MWSGEDSEVVQRSLDKRNLPRDVLGSRTPFEQMNRALRVGSALGTAPLVRIPLSKVASPSW